MITLIPISVEELVNLNGTSRDSTPLSATLSTTVSHSRPCEPCTVITESRYLLPTILLMSASWAVYGVSTATSDGSSPSLRSMSATAIASALFSLPSLLSHTTSMQHILRSPPSDEPVMPFL